MCAALGRASVCVEEGNTAAFQASGGGCGRWERGECPPTTPRWPWASCSQPTGDSVLGPGPRPPHPPPTQLCTQLLQTGQVPAQHGPRLGTKGKPGSSPPPPWAPGQPCSTNSFLSPVTSAWLHTSRALGWGWGGKAPGHTAGGGGQPQPAQSQGQALQSFLRQLSLVLPRPPPLRTH